jgi:hypothetical protein
MPRSAVVLPACLAALVLPSTAGAAALVATPGIPARGTSVTLAGTGFARGASGVANLSGQRSVGFRVDGHGRASVVIRVRRSAGTGAHRLVMRAGRTRISTTLTVVGSRGPLARLVALSSGQRALLAPAHARSGDRFTLKVTGLRRGASTQVKLGGVAIADRRADARGGLAIIDEVPPLAAARHLVRVTSGRTRIDVALVVRAAGATTGSGEATPPLGIGGSLGQPPAVAEVLPASPPLPLPPASGPVRIAAAGDIACAPGKAVTSQGCRQGAVSDLLVAGNYAAVLALGDVQYYCGSLAAFHQVYAPSWGRVLARTHPVVGNHEYLTSGDVDCSQSNASAAGYFDYFGAAAGTRGQGYYSFDVGAWHLIALNSNCGDVGGCDASTPEGRWLAQDLAAHRSRCTLAYWHIPLFSSGGRAKRNTQPFWSQLYNAGADLVLTGHDHIYERFAPQRPDGSVDARSGIREFVVGTGGANHTTIRSVAANSEVRDAATFGVLELTLSDGSYDWRFRPESGGRFTDSGATACH